MEKMMQRTVAFYRLQLRSREDVAYKNIEGVNWEKHLSEFSKLKWEQKAIGSVRYDALFVKKYPVLSVSEQFDPAFMQFVDGEHQRVMDYMDNYLADGNGRLAKSSAFAFFPDHGLVGRVSGSSGKSTEPLKKALNNYWPADTGWEWDVMPVITTDSLERFENELKGLTSFTACFTTERNLSSRPEDGGDTGVFYSKMSDRIGADLDIELKVSLSRGGPFSVSSRKFKKTVSDLVHFVAGQDKQMHVVGTDFADKMLELNLVKHPVVEQANIVIEENEPRQFTLLINHLIEICAQKQDYLYEIVQE
ncbi:ImpB/MucB/SamB family protein [Bifidobacterium sp. ESL0790]|uniref:ImpB/MucB/SamB family protein n=1 Tax=Bifidobacterium sp. ESL0790 TaxID=2983233 RepID=UPI0023F9FFA1|nr:ImpB/MucB/SamB family protein [Bifidobacterium sp. ESL0790]WEV71995.1 ImpB/MucB/SamB family protein [Bifidobacterium sp. ESL0790]